MLEEQKKEVREILVSKPIKQSIIKTQARSMRENREITGLICNSKLHILPSISNSKKSTVLLNSNLVNEICKNDKKGIFFHTHANLVSDPSLMDYNAFNIIFSIDGIKYACNSGTDGVFCVDEKRREAHFPLVNDLDSEILKNNKNFVIFSDEFYCDKTKTNPDEYQCTFFWKNTSYKLNKPIKQVAIGNLKTVLNDQPRYLNVYANKPKEVIKCVGSNTNNASDGTILICNKINTDALSKDIETCNTIDMCNTS